MNEIREQLAAMLAAIKGQMGSDELMLDYLLDQSKQLEEMICNMIDDLQEGIT